MPTILSCDDVKPAELLQLHCSHPVRPGPRLSVLSAESVDRSDACFMQTAKCTKHTFQTYPIASSDVTIESLELFHSVKVSLSRGHM